MHIVLRDDNSAIHTGKGGGGGDAISFFAPATLGHTPLMFC